MLLWSDPSPVELFLHRCGCPTEAAPVVGLTLLLSTGVDYFCSLTERQTIYQEEYRGRIIELQSLFVPYRTWRLLFVYARLSASQTHDYRHVRHTTTTSRACLTFEYAVCQTSPATTTRFPLLTFL